MPACCASTATFDAKMPYLESPDESKIFFHRPIVISGVPNLELFMMNADGTGITQLTQPPGHSAFANGGAVRTHVRQQQDH